MTGTRRETKRQRILDAAVVEIARHGYYGTTVSSIARRAGVADGTIYLYFKNKEEVLVSIFQRAMRRFIEAAARIVNAEGGAEEKLRHVITLHLGLLGENRDLAVIFQVEFRHTLHVLELLSRSGIRDYLALIARVIEEGKRDATFRRDVDAQFAAKVIFGILDEMATDWVLSKKNTRMVTRADPVGELLLGGLRGQPLGKTRHVHSEIRVTRG
jgi:TetR/AcrR family fatty acid metabolism transcriptional regulator